MHVFSAGYEMDACVNCPLLLILFYFFVLLYYFNGWKMEGFGFYGHAQNDLCKDVVGPKCNPHLGIRNLLGLSRSQTPEFDLL